MKERLTLLFGGLVTQAQAKPLITAALGATASGGSFALAWGEHVKLWLQILGLGLGVLTGAIALLLSLPGFLRFLRRWRERGFLHADGK